MRAKFQVSSVEMWQPAPFEVTRFTSSGTDSVKTLTWPRKYTLHAVYDDGTPENQRFALASPSGQLTIQVDNPVAELVPGKAYYIDFTPVDAD